MKIIIEYDTELIYDVAIEDGKIYVTHPDGFDIKVEPTAVALVTELQPYEIQNLAQLFSVLNKKDTVVLNVYDDEDFALVCSSEINKVDLESSEWFEYFDSTTVLDSCITRHLIRKKCKPQEMTFVDIVKKYNIR